ncbi:unnamed protein product, partial [Discosporangium mesarthrocarpum]
RTAQEWLKKTCCKYDGHKSGIYSDGHDRDDVVAYRDNEYIPG